MEYGCILYAAAANTNLNELTVIQNRCLKIATGVFKSVKTEILEVETGIYPLQDHFTKVITNFAATVAFKEDHPLRELLSQYNRYILASHHPFSTRAYLLARKYKIPLGAIEAFPEVDGNVWENYKGKIYLNTHLNRNECPLQLYREALLIIAGFPGLEHFYTDGSKKGSIVGSGIYSRFLKCGHRLPIDFSVFDADSYCGGVVIHNR